MSSEAVSKITDAEKKEKAKLLIAKFNERDDLLEGFFREMSESYKPGVRLNILKEAVKLGGVQRDIASSRKAMLLRFYTPEKRVKGMLEGVLAAFELIARAEFEEDTVLIEAFSEMLDFQLGKKKSSLNQLEMIDLVKRFTFGGALVRKTVENRKRENLLNFHYLEGWTALLQPLLGVRSAGQGLQPSDAERILDILITVPREEMPDQAFLTLPRLAHIGGSSATSKLMRSSFSDCWGQLVQDASGGSSGTVSDESRNSGLSPGQVGLLTAIRDEFGALESQVKEATEKLEGETKRYNLLNDRKNDLEREFHAKERELESKIHRLDTEMRVRTGQRDKLTEDAVHLVAEKAELSKEIDQLHHQGKLGDEIDAQSEKDQLQTLMLKPIENMRGLISMALDKNRDIKELKGIAAGLEQFVRRIERKFELSLGIKIPEDLYRRTEEK